MVGAPVVQPPVIPVVETPLTPRPQASPILLQPPPNPQSPAMDMTQLLQFFQMQQDRSQQHLEQQMQQQAEREKRMFDMMMASQQSFIKQQEKSQQDL